MLSLRFLLYAKLEKKRGPLGISQSQERSSGWSCDGMDITSLSMILKAMELGEIMQRVREEREEV